MKKNRKNKTAPPPGLPPETGQIVEEQPKKQPSIRSRAEIQDFFYLHSQIRPGEETGYMALEEYKNVRQPLPAVADLRAEEREPEKAPENKAAPTMEELLAQLAKKYDRH